MHFPRRFLRALLFAPVLGLAVPIVAHAEPSSSLSLEEAVALATSRAANAETSRGAIESATQMAVAAGQLPDPVLKLGVNNVPVNGSDQFSLSRDFMTMRSISVMQEFTRSDKRRARAARFEAEAASAEAQRTVGVAGVQRSVAAAWLERWYAEQTDVLLSHHSHPLELEVQAATAAYRSGRGTRADVLAAEMEIQKLQDRRDENQAVIDAAKANLERWVGAASNRRLSERPPIVVPAQIQQLGQADMDAVPELAAAQRDVARAEADIRVATEARKPDVSVELMYSQRGSAYSNMASVNVSFPLPWDRANRQDREVSAKLAEAEQARAKSEVVARTTRAQLAARLAELQRNLGRLQRYDEKLLPLANAQADAALTAYRANSGTLLAVAEANHRAIDTALERLMLEARTAKLWAELAYLIPLPTAQTEPATKEFK
ncbi:TolC family protein [Ralstonia pseudosolanacearum]|uniref:TolC family protein n=1 Tax=Ralstonia pseudosolanacearum TaxID=1310165 RepID=UPI003AAF44F1